MGDSEQWNFSTETVDQSSTPWSHIPTLLQARAAQWASSEAGWSLHTSCYKVGCWLFKCWLSLPANPRGSRRPESMASVWSGGFPLCRGVGWIELGVRSILWNRSSQKHFDKPQVPGSRKSNTGKRNGYISQSVIQTPTRYWSWVLPQSVDLGLFHKAG